MAVPQKRAEHEGVLQALGLVHGHDLHQVAVRRQTQLRGVVAAALSCALRALGLQPAAQRLGRGVGLGSVMQHVGQVQQVGQAPFAVRPRQQA